MGRAPISTHGEARILELRLNLSCSSRTVIWDMGLLLGLGAGRKPGSEIVGCAVLRRMGEMGVTDEFFI